MSLITPAVGLLFWTVLVFGILLFLLGKFAWKPILSAVKTREENIDKALNAAEEAKAAVAELESKNKDLLKEARAERDAMMKDARETANQIVEDAKAASKGEAAKILEDARNSIETERTAMLAEVRHQVAALSLEIAERIIRGELASDAKQKALAEKLAEEVNLN